MSKLKVKNTKPQKTLQLFTAQFPMKSVFIFCFTVDEDVFASAKSKVWDVERLVARRFNRSTVAEVLEAVQRSQAAGLFHCTAINKTIRHLYATQMRAADDGGSLKNQLISNWRLLLEWVRLSLVYKIDMCCAFYWLHLKSLASWKRSNCTCLSNCLITCAFVWRV